MGKREELRKRREARARQNRVTVLVIVGVLAVAVTGYMIYLNTRPLGDIVMVEPVSLPFPDSKTLGSADAPVTIQVFSDFQCPFCGRFADSTERELIDQYVASGKARLEFRHFIVVDGNVGGNESRRAAEASECAEEQAQFWTFHSMLFANQHGEGEGAFSDRRLKAFAGALGLDTAEFNACFDSRRYASEVQADDGLARSLGAKGTPTVFVNGTQVENPLDMAELQRLIEGALGS